VLTAEPSQLLAGRYRVETVLARGAVAVVYGATDLRLRRPVTVKMLLPERAADPELRDRFEIGARAAASFSHPNAVAIHDRGDEEGVGYLVMERLAGTTIADEIRGGPLSEPRVIEVGRQVLAALAAAHGAGIVHGDVKPGNILTCEGGSVKVADFGISTTTAIDPVLATGGETVGTPPYLPPERLDGRPLSAAVDIYSTGAVLYECLAGRPLFEGDSADDLVASIRHGRPKPIRRLRPKANGALIAVIERALDPDPAMRFVSAEAMSYALVRPSGASGPPVLPAGPIPLPAGPVERLVHAEEDGEGPAVPPATASSPKTDYLPAVRRPALPAVRRPALPALRRAFPAARRAASPAVRGVAVTAAASAPAGPTKLEMNWRLLAVLGAMMLGAGLLSGGILLAANGLSRPTLSAPPAGSVLPVTSANRSSFEAGFVPVTRALQHLATSLPSKRHSPGTHRRPRAPAHHATTHRSPAKHKRSPPKHHSGT
jgi:hypothetical protein